MSGIKWNLIQIQKKFSDHSSLGQAWISLAFLLYFYLLWYVTDRIERKPAVLCSVNIGSGVIEVLCWGGADRAENKTALMLSSQKPSQASVGLSAKTLIKLFCCLQQQRFSEQSALPACLYFFCFLFKGKVVCVYI